MHHIPLPPHYHNYEFKTMRPPVVIDLFLNVSFVVLISTLDLLRNSCLLLHVHGSLMVFVIGNM